MLPDHGVVWNHHSHRPEQGFEVVGEFGPSGVPGVHGDEGSASGNERQIRSLEHEVGHVVHDRSLDGENLLGYHG